MNTHTKAVKHTPAHTHSHSASEDAPSSAEHMCLEKIQMFKPGHNIARTAQPEKAKSSW